MSLYAVFLFLHVVGAVALGSVLCFEAAALAGLRRATTTEAGQWLSLLRTARLLGRPAGPTVLLSGIYLSVARWGAAGWIIVGLAAIVLIGVIEGALGTRRLAAITATAEAEGDAISSSLRTLFRDPMLELSLSLRGGLFLGIVFLMCTKPGAMPSVGVIAASLVAGYVVGLPGRSGRLTRA